MPRDLLGLVEILLAEQCQRLHHGPVGDCEQVGCCAGAVFDGGPGWHYEHITPAPVETLAVDDAVAAALEDHEDGTAYLAIRLRVTTGNDAVHLAAHRRHDGCAGGGIDKFDARHASAAHSQQRFEGGNSVGTAIDKQG